MSNSDKDESIPEAFSGILYFIKPFFDLVNKITNNKISACLWTHLLILVVLSVIHFGFITLSLAIQITFVLSVLQLLVDNFEWFRMLGSTKARVDFMLSDISSMNHKKLDELLKYEQLSDFQKERLLKELDRVFLTPHFWFLFYIKQKITLDLLMFITKHADILKTIPATTMYNVILANPMKIPKKCYAVVLNNYKKDKNTILLALKRSHNIYENLETMSITKKSSFLAPITSYILRKWDFFHFMILFFHFMIFLFVFIALDRLFIYKYSYYGILLILFFSGIFMNLLKIPYRLYRLEDKSLNNV